MTSSTEPHDLALERFRQYLVLLARMQIGGRNPARLDASDIAQQALLDAHRKRHLFRGKSDGELIAWLREILAGSLRDALKALNRAKRDPKRERQIHADLEASSARLEALLVADQSSPSMQAERHEHVIRLAAALAELPDAQREAMVLRHCHGLTLAEVGKHLGCNISTAAGYLARASKRLSELLQQDQSLS